MIAAVIVLVAVEFISSSSTHPIDTIELPRRVKRLAFGRDLYSNKYFGTEYLVEIRHNYECVVEHDEHRDLLQQCNGNHVCGSTLIHPQYLISAAHCLMYAEIIVYDEPRPESFWDQILGAWNNSVRAITAFFIFTKPKHTIDSDWSLLAGGTNRDTMTQIRHVSNIFPHRYWPNPNVTSTDTDLAHDFLLIQACEPFKIEENVKPVVLEVKSKMAEHYEQIVKLGLVCLYVGKGRSSEDDYDEYSHTPLKEPYTNWTQFMWSPSSCYSACGYGQSNDTEEHTCKLCATPFGPSDADALPGDSGNPVLCDGKVVAVVSYSGQRYPGKNDTIFTASYAIHCSRNMITRKQLEYYSGLNLNRYHPSGGYRKLRKITDVHQ